MTEAARLELVSGAVDLPVSLAEAKAACRIDGTDTADDGYLTILIGAAAAKLGGRYGYVGQSMTAESWRAYWDGPVAGALLLPIGPVASVSAVKIDAGSGLIAATLEDFRTVKDKFMATVEPVSGTWPAMIADVDAVAVEFTAGDAEAPAPVKLAILTLVAFWYDNRDGGIMAKVSAEIDSVIESLLINERRF